MLPLSWNLVRCVGRVALVVAALLSSLVLCPRLAIAQTGNPTDATAPEPAEYRSIVDEALREFDAHHYSEARALFLKAHAINPNARTLRGLGISEYELRHYVRALALLKQALVDPRKPLTAELRASTEAAAKRVEPFVGRCLLRIEPANADVVIDGVAAQLAADGTIELDAGVHTLEVSAPGFVAHTEDVDVAGGSEQALTVRLEPDAPPLRSTALQEATPRAAQAEPSNRGAGVWPWVVAGGSGALMIAGGVLLALAQHDMSKVRHAKKGSSWAEVESAYEAVPGRRIAGAALLAAGAAGVVTGLVWQVMSNGSPEQERAVTAALTPGGLMIEGRF